jgi:predicted Zn-ribbon and HTH transcriptional regulator
MNGLEVPDVVDNNDFKSDLKSVLEVITKKMWSDRKKEKDIYCEIKNILKTVDAQGLIVYCSPTSCKAQDCMKPMYKSMIKTMWDERNEYERNQKKQKRV